MTLKRVVFERYGKTQHLSNKHIFKMKSNPRETLAKYSIFGHPLHIYTVKNVCFNLDRLGFVDKYTSLKHFSRSLPVSIF